MIATVKTMGSGRACSDRRRNTVGFRALTATVLPLVVLIYSFLLLPPETRVTIADLSLPLYRLILIPLFMRVMFLFVTGRVRFQVADVFVLLASASTLTSFMHHYGASEGAIRGFGILVDSAGAYFAARICIRTPNDLRVFLVLIVPGLLFAGMMMALESVTHNFIMRPFFARYLGATYVYGAGEETGARVFRYEYRMGGLLRAYGPFSHPILGGLILSSSLLLYWTSGIRAIFGKIGNAVGLLGFFALSSATIISIMLSVVIFALNAMVQRIRTLNWWAVVLGFILVGLVLEVGSASGLVNVLIRQTLDPQTGYYRKLIWEYGVISVSHNQLYGIGYAEYERPLGLLPSASVDAHFLALGIRDGVIVPLAVLAALILTQIRLGRAVGRVTGPDRKLLLGVNGVLVTLLVASMTVTFFGEGLIWFMAFLGIGASLAQKKLNAPSGRVEGIPPPGAKLSARDFT